MLETSLPSFPGMDCPSERTGRTVQRQLTIALLFTALMPPGWEEGRAQKREHLRWQILLTSPFRT